MHSAVISRHLLTAPADLPHTPSAAPADLPHPISAAAATLPHDLSVAAADLARGLSTAAADLARGLSAAAADLPHSLSAAAANLPRGLSAAGEGPAHGVSALVVGTAHAVPTAEVVGTLLAACVLAFALAWLSSVGGVGGSVLMLLAFTALFGMRTALPVLALAQLASNGGRVWLNRRDIRWRLLLWYGAGAIPFAVIGGLLLSWLPVEPLKRLLGVFLIAVIGWRRLQTSPRVPANGVFVAVGAGTGLGSSLFGAAGSLAAPFFLAKGLVGATYIGTEAAASLIIHLSKVATYGAGDLLSPHVLRLGLALAPAIVAGAWLGKKTVMRMPPGTLTLLIELGTLASAILLLTGI